MGLRVMHVCRSCFTPSPSGMTWVAQKHVMRSVIISILRESPVDVGHTRPVKVCTRSGTRAIQAASMHRRPALGVIECTMHGFSFIITFVNLKSDRRSLKGDMCRSMLTPMVRTCSLLPSSARSSSGDERAMTSYPSWLSSVRSPRQKMLSDMPIVAARIIFLPTKEEGRDSLQFFIVCAILVSLPTDSLNYEFDVSH